jgi:hypothetical protein
MLAGLVQVEGYKISLNSTSAKPRQIDFAITGDLGHFVAEAKWKKNVIDVGDIDSLRSRVRRSVPGTWGIFFSMSDYSKTAINDLARDKALPIVLFNAAEINLLFNGKLSFTDVLQKKQSDLRNGRLSFLKPEAGRHHRSFGPATEYLHNEKGPVEWWECNANEFDLVYGRYLPEYPSYRVPPQTVTTNVEVSSLDDLERVFQAASQALKLSGDGAFTVYQENRNWHGIGIRNFLRCIENWKERYALQGWDSYHHSEELAYFEQSNVGLFALSARQRVGQSSFLHSAQIEFLLPGIPIDADPYKTLMKIVGANTPFFYSNEQWKTHRIYLKRSVRLQVHGTVLKSAIAGAVPSISGVVAINPFFGKNMQMLLHERYIPEADWAAESEILVCRLEDWIPFGTEVDEYKLLDFTFTRVNDVKLVIPSCTWSHITKKASGKPAFDFESMLRMGFRKYEVN